MNPAVYVNPAAAHAEPGHPERPGRVHACVEALGESGVPALLRSAGPAARDDLRLVHDPSYLARLESFCASGGGRLDPDTYACPGSFEEARLSSGACIAAARASFEEEPRSFCLVRPPGHHARPGAAMGFCLLNHAAVSVRAVQAAGLARSVAVVDIDVHHGNGTQEVFWEDPSVLYVSLHQFPWYPGTGALGETGSGPGEGATINVPLPAGSGDAVYLMAMEQVVAPAVRAFSPGLILVSAGFDAHAGDPLASMNVTAPGFAAMFAVLGELADETCGGRMACVLEGGYEAGALAASFMAALGAISGKPPGAVDAREAAGAPPEQPEALEAVQEAARFHASRLRA